jgi:hypothetical protein
MNEDPEIANAVRSASALVDKMITFDADTAESGIKYSVWISAFATAGFGLVLSNYDKISKWSWLRADSSAMRIVLLFTCLLFLLSMICSAAIVRLSTKYLATFKRRRELISTQEFIMTNHPKVVQSATYWSLVMRGVPTRFIPEQIFNDIAEQEGGTLVKMGYDSEPTDINAKEAKDLSVHTMRSRSPLSFPS